MDEFIESSKMVLNMDFAWDDLNTLLKVMSVFNEINERNNHVQDLFEPLRKVVDLLLIYNVTVPERCSIQVNQSHPLSVCSIVQFTI